MSDDGLPPDEELPPPEVYEGEPAGSEGRHVIQIEAGKLHAYADAAERLLAPDVYARGQQLVRLGLAPELAPALAKGITRAKDQRVMLPVNTEWLRRALSARAEFQRWSQGRERFEPRDCPPDLVRNILEAGDWQHFRQLEGIATAPFVRADGSICDVPGYDAASRVYYAPNAEFPPIPTEPTADDADGAMERLLEPFCEFPFATTEARAAFATHILAAVARHAIDTRPAIAYTAPMPATGKTLAAAMPNLIADGTAPGTRPFPEAEEELRKVLMSALLASDSTVLLDNLPNGAKVRSPMLCVFLTGATYTDRKLGVSESPTLPNRCQVLLTGNNVTPTSDLARRTLVVRLDVEAESARGRQFRIADLKAYVREHRPRLLVDALTVIRAHVLAGSPSTLRPLDSFERWSRLARDPVAWLGYGDAVGTQALETDDEIAPLKQAFEQLAARETFRRPFRMRDVIAACEFVSGEDLRSAIESSGCSDATAAKPVTYWLREHRDRVAGGWKLVKAGEHAGSARWQLRHV
jgi:putative DNA primase/helicase